MRHLAERIARDYGAADGLVNNPEQPDRARGETTAAQWQRVMNINLFGPFLLCRHLGAQMLARGQGSIVNVASVAGLAGVSHRSAYNSKHGLIGLTRRWRPNGGGRGVRVNAVVRDGSRPKWMRRTRGAVRTRTRTSSIACPWRASQGADVAEAIAFLVDGDRSGFINGVSLPVDGGWTADASWDSLRMRTRQ